MAAGLGAMEPEQAVQLVLLHHQGPSCLPQHAERLSLGTWQRSGMRERTAGVAHIAVMLRHSGLSRGHRRSAGREGAREKGPNRAFLLELTLS